MSLDQDLARFYGNLPAAAAPTAQDLEKQASVDLFLKLASEQNIDLNAMSEEQIQTLYNKWAGSPKTAAADDEKKEKELKEKAEKEHKEASAKFAEADYLGKVMAHSCYATMRKLAEEDGGKFPFPPKKKKDDKDEEKEERKKEEKEASALDQLAARKALELVNENKGDTKEASARLNAVFTLGLQVPATGETSKTASAANLEQAVHVRALELLEKAGYQVNWGA